MASRSSCSQERKQKNNRLLGFRPQPPSNYDEIRRRLLAMSLGMDGPLSPPRLSVRRRGIPRPSYLQCLPVFEPHKKFGDGPLLSGPCIIIMTLPTTDDIWITAPLFQYPSLPHLITAQSTTSFWPASLVVLPSHSFMAYNGDHPGGPLSFQVASASLGGYALEMTT